MVVDAQDKQQLNNHPTADGCVEEIRIDPAVMAAANNVTPLVVTAAGKKSPTSNDKSTKKPSSPTAATRTPTSAEKVHQAECHCVVL